MYLKIICHKKIYFNLILFFVFTSLSADTQKISSNIKQENKKSQAVQNCSKHGTRPKLDQSKIQADKTEKNSSSFNFPIRVLLDLQNNKELVDWTLESDNGFIVINARHKKKIFIPSNKLNIKMGTNKWLLNGSGQHSQTLFILPKSGCLKFNEFIYDGAFALASIGDKGYLVNHLDLEDYVASVMKSESWPGWPDEINKAFSICFRSYGVAKILEQRQIYKNKKLAIPYDIKNSNHHQVYKGCRNTDFFKKITKQTERLVLTHNNKPIVAMFDISCGGVIPAHLNGLDFKKAPYLARSYKCNYCKNYNLTNWSSQYAFKDLEKLLNAEFNNFGKLLDIQITKKDKAGVVEQLSIKGSRRTLTITAKKFKQLVKNLKSLCFTLVTRKNNLILNGKGYGHLAGLCQRGAHTMVMQGWSDRDILKFYYPGTTLMRLKYKANTNP